jgi:integrase
VKDGKTCRNGHDSIVWSYVVDIAPDGAPRKQRTKSGFATKKEAVAALNEIQRKADAGQLVDPSRMTYGQFLEERWLPWLEATDDLRESTKASYIDVLKHARPTLDNIPLQSITTDMLSTLYATIRKTGGRHGKGLAPKTVRYCGTVVGRTFKDAKRWNLIALNPARDADLPKASATKSRAAQNEAWDEVQLQRFWKHTENDRLFPLWWLLAALGVRRAEALGLKWHRVHLDATVWDEETGQTISAPYLQITETRSTINHRVVEEDMTKTNGSTRRISLDSVTVKVLREWRKTQLEERMELGGAWADTGHVFTREDGKPWHPDWISKLFQMRVEKSGLPRIPLKGLRHSMATVALANGEHPKVVQERLGHATIQQTMDTYSHVTERVDREAAERIARRMMGSG